MSENKFENDVKEAGALIAEYSFNAAKDLKQQITKHKKLTISMSDEEVIQDYIDILELAKHLTWNPITRWKIRNVIKELKKQAGEVD